MRTTGSAIAGVAVAVLMVTACTSSASSTAPSGTPAASISSAPAVQSFVSITLSPVVPASTHDLAAAAQLIGERAARSGLLHARAAVSGRNVVLTGLAADQNALESLAGMGVLRIRHVLLQQPAGGGTHGDAGLVQPGVLRLFRKLVCNPGESDAAWQREVGYTTSAAWDDPTAQVVSCSSGTKYALGVAAVLGQEVTGAVASPGQPPGQWVVALTVNSAGASAFGALTTHLYNTYHSGFTTGNQNDMVLDQAAVVLDGTVLSAPLIDGPIAGGHLEISGSFTRAAVGELAAELQGGPLPVAFRIAGTSTFNQTASS
jgi:preprotein translocase subunit SecD